MKQKVRNNPEDIMVVSGVELVGEDIRLNRERATLTLLGVSRTDTEIEQNKFNEIIEGGIDDSEKNTLKKELDSITNSYDLLRRQARDADLGASDEVLALEDAYNKLFNLMNKIINSVGIYSANDVNDLNPYYADFNKASTDLTNVILSIQTEQSVETSYLSRTHVSVNIVPEIIPAPTTSTESWTAVTARIVYDDTDVNTPSLIPSSAFKYVVTGLARQQASDFRSSETGFQVTFVGTTAVIDGFRQFDIKYDAVGSAGIVVELTLTLDTDSIQF